VRIGIVGLGLIGGSLGLELRSQQDDSGTPCHTVLGVSRRPETCEQAIARGVVDAAATEIELLESADVTFLCTPLAAIESTVKALLPVLNSTTVLTDVGSVKAPVVEAIAPYWQNFVGGHPMAGKAESGLEAAELGLFAGKAYVLTPIASTPIAAVETVAAIARSLKAEVYQCDPDHHDRAVAWISHLPVMVSASLLAACLTEADPIVRDLAEKFASSGFRDTSRVGGGSPELGVMMARYNQTALLRSLYAYRHQLEQIIQQVEQADWSALTAQLEHTQAARPHFVRNAAEISAEEISAKES
jgi:arogenate dehydrogenase (NADP+)